MSSTFTISNGNITAVCSSAGAELISLKNSDGKEFLFRDKNIWDFSSPILFPICGGLKDDIYLYEGKKYTLPKHGFARNSEFSVESINENSIVFLMTDNAETLKVYPFKFEFRVSYSLCDDSLNVEFDVKNTGNNKMFFLVGSHEAFLCPEGINKYSIIFDKKETLDSHIVKGNLLDYETQRIIKNSEKLQLSYDYFKVDALAFSKFNSEKLMLCADDGTRIIQVEFPGFSHLLLWTKNDIKAPYICIEPWCGFPDMIDSDYDITEKAGIIQLSAGESRTVTHSITLIK